MLNLSQYLPQMVLSLIFAGPFYSTLNDAPIMKIILEDPPSLKKLLPNNVFIVDCGFRDVVELWNHKGFNVLMPTFKVHHQRNSIDFHGCRTYAFTEIQKEFVQ